MRVNYYILRNGILKRKQNTVYFVYKADAANPKEKVVTTETEGTDESQKLAEKVETVKPGIEKRIIPIEKISAIYAYGRISFTSGVISYLSKYGTPVHFYNFYGFYEGSY